MFGGLKEMKILKTTQSGFEGTMELLIIAEPIHVGSVQVVEVSTFQGWLITEELFLHFSCFGHFTGNGSYHILSSCKS